MTVTPEHTSTPRHDETTLPLEEAATHALDEQPPASDGGLPPGTKLDHFRLVRRLGHGGMGEVYLARDTRLGRKVALKLIHSKLARSRSDIDRFLEEARVTATFNHPHIVTIFDVGQAEGQPYVALEYLEGDNLRRRLFDRPPGLTEALRMGLAIADALVEAHRHGILHRDLKPENVVVPADGRLRVVDFGLAKAAEVLRPDSDTDSPGEDKGAWPAGTPQYMAPEQWAQKPLTAAVDVWALGLILFEAIAGKPPYPWERRMDQIMDDAFSDRAVPRLDSVVTCPEDVANLVADCVNKEAVARPSARDVADRIRALLERGENQSAPGTDGPFRGLEPFLEAHAAQYYGREDEVGLVLERARNQPVLTIVGPSGAGKSSFVRAGVLPRLRERGSLSLLTVRPGAAPFAVLAGRLLKSHPTATSALGRSMAHEDNDALLSMERQLVDNPRLLGIELRRQAEELGKNVVLFIDQLEELFTLSNDEDIQHRFLQALFTAADDPSDPVRVLVTVRDDFLGRMASVPEARLGLGQLTVLRLLGSEDLQSIFERSVAATGFEFEDAKLPGDMVAELADTPGALALLQFAGERLWERRDQKARILRRAAYDEMGGVAGALGRHADAVLDGLSSAQVTVARRLLLRLVTSSRTRAVVPRTEALDGLPDDATQLLDQLISARLVVTRKIRSPDGETISSVELVHESLLSHWTTLSRWLDASREDHALLADAAKAAERWERLGKRDGELWRDEALADARRAAERMGGDVPPRVARFLDASFHKQERRQIIRRAVVSASITMLALLALTFAWQKRRADEARDDAFKQREEAIDRQAESLREAARADRQTGRMLQARANVRASLEARDTTEARALWWQLQRDPLIWTKKLSDTVIYDVVPTPSGNELVAGCQNGVVYVLDTTTSSVRELRGHTDQVLRVAVSPDGRQAVSASWNGELIWWDLATGQMMQRDNEVGAVPQLVRFVRNGTHLVFRGSDQSLSVWSVSDRAIAGTIKTRRPISAEAVIDGKQQLLLAERSGQIGVYDLSSLEQVGELRAQGDIKALARGADDDHVLVLNDSGSLENYRIVGNSLEHLWSVDLGNGIPWGLAVDPSGTDVVVTQRRGDAVVVSLKDGQVTGELDATLLVRRAAYSPTAGRLATGGFGEVHWLDLSQVRRAQATDGHAKGVLSTDVSGALVASGDYDGEVRLWDLERGEVVRTLRGHRDSVHEVDFDPTGRRLLSAASDNSIRIWDVETGLVEYTLSVQGTDNAEAEAAFADSGKLVVAGTNDGKLARFRLPEPDTDAGAPVELPLLGNPTNGTADLAVDPNSTRVALTSRTGTVQIFDLGTEAVERTLQLDGAMARSAAFDTAGGLYVGTSEGELLHFPADGDQRLILSLSKRIGTVVRIYDLQLEDAGTLVLSDSSGFIRRVNPSTGSMETLARFDDEVNEVALGATRDVLVGASDDRTLRVFDRKGAPLWRGIALLGGPPRALSHRGWHVPGSGEVSAPSDPLSTAMSASIEARSSKQGTWCLRFSERVEVWEPTATKPAATTRRRAVSMEAIDNGCVVQDPEGVALLQPNTAETTSILVARDIDALGSDGQDEIYVARGELVLVFAPDGRELRRFKVAPGITSLARIGNEMAAGFRDGSVRLPLSGERAAPRFEGTAASPVARLLEGPAETIAIGFGNGAVGLWHTGDGRQLMREQLHGPVTHLMLDDRGLMALSALGQARRWDLGPFYADYCDILREVWRDVPIGLEDGRVVEKGPTAMADCKP